jgi:hypothetical protein
MLHAMRRYIASALSVVFVAAACHAGDPARAPGEQVMAPVASIEVPPPAAHAPVASASASAPAPSTPPLEPDDDQPDEGELPSVSPPPPSAQSGPPIDPCSGHCTGNTICWVYDHRPRPSPAPPDASVLGQLLDDEDAGAFRSETHCLPQSARCPVGTNSMSSRFVMVNGAAARWNTCTFFDGP